jgi:hypothetical protein
MKQWELKYMPDNELIEVYEQLKRLKNTGSTDEYPIRKMLDDYGTNGLLLVPNMILEEIAMRWHYSKTK